MAELRTACWPAERTGEVLDITVGELLRQTAVRAPDTVALVEGLPDPAVRRRWSYAGLLASAERAARALLGRFEPGVNSTGFRNA
jgi:non-ribosomal peptide synthetase component E (peptide arylation enzyme)